jgi:hypothetical protein
MVCAPLCNTSPPTKMWVHTHHKQNKSKKTLNETISQKKKTIKVYSGEVKKLKMKRYKTVDRTQIREKKCDMIV